MKLTPAVALALAASLAPRGAAAFCGFYVSPGDKPLYADATQVVLMRSGTRTVLAMQNDYHGPPDAFALVVPVPVVLHEQDVKTLPKDVFAKVEQMGAPRLVEYWEQDPCYRPPERDYDRVNMSAGYGAAKPDDVKSAELGVKVEAKFAVGEYQIVILSATEATALDTWLRQNKYKIPEGAAPLLRPYVESGSKFFVAKVDPQKVKFDEGGHAALSPLRFHYDSDDFALPIRLGLASSSGTQDLIVNILAPNQRYIVGNRPSVTIPTNFDVKDAVRERFAAFYTALFDRTLEKNPNAVVTEYAWQATTCDPCPGPTLDGNDFALLGADVLAGPHDKPQPYGNADFVLTRLHARYGKEIKDDLVFASAPAIAGGRETTAGDGRLEHGAQPSSYNNFQARYAIRHPWLGAIECEHPRRGVWGGPPRGEIATGTKPATGLAFAARSDIQLAAVVTRDVPEIELKVGASDPGAPSTTGATHNQAKKKSGCGCGVADDDGVLGGIALVGACAVVVRRRRK
jgi:MYXO-CTERM domain-containing protein